MKHHFQRMKPMKLPCHFWIQPCHHVQPSYHFPAFPLQSNLHYLLSCLFLLQPHSNAEQPNYGCRHKRRPFPVTSNNLSVHFLNLSTVFLNFSPGYFFFPCLAVCLAGFLRCFVFVIRFSPPQNRALTHKHFVFYLRISAAVISPNCACISSPNHSSHSSSTFLPACPLIHEARDGLATGIKIRERIITPINSIETKFIIDVYWILN